MCSTHDTLIRRRKVTRGLSLVEAVISTVIVSVMLVAALDTVAGAARSRQKQFHRQQGSALVQGLITEILQAAYEEPQTAPDIESSETTLASFDLASATEARQLFWNSPYAGQLFQPTLPADATGWRVTRVKFRGAQVPPTDGVLKVQLRGTQPGLVVNSQFLVEKLIPETSLPASMTWIEASFSDLRLQEPGAQLALVLGHGGGAATMAYERESSGGASDHIWQGYDGSSTWYGSDAHAMRFYVYGTVTTPPVSTALFGRESPESADLRSTWDDIDDYDGWSAKPPQDRHGNELQGYEAWKREVTVTYADPADATDGGQSVETNLKRITVRAIHESGYVLETSALRSRYGGYEVVPEHEATFMRWVGVDLVTERDTAVSTGMNVLMQQEQ